MLKIAPKSLPFQFFSESENIKLIHWKIENAISYKYVRIPGLVLNNM